MEIIWVFAASLLAFTLSAVTGGGASMLLVPLLGFYLPATAIPFAITLASAVSSLARLYALRQHIAWRLVARFVPASLPGAAAGVYLLSFLNPAYLQLLIGCLLLANLPVLFSKTEVKSSRLLGHGTVVAIGFAAGFVSGLTGAVGLLFNRFYLSSGLEPKQIVATRAANEVLLHLVKLALYIALGVYVEAAGSIGGSLALGALVAGFAVKPALTRINTTLFRKLGYGVMVVSGAVMLVGASQSIARLQGVELALAASRNQVETKLAWGRHGQVALEFEWGEGPEFERQIALADMPDPVRAKMLPLIVPGQRYVVEEVFAFRSHGYELYNYTPQGIVKHDFEH